MKKRQNRQKKSIKCKKCTETFKTSSKYMVHCKKVHKKIEKNDKSKKRRKRRNKDSESSKRISPKSEQVRDIKKKSVRSQSTLRNSDQLERKRPKRQRRKIKSLERASFMTQVEFKKKFKKKSLKNKSPISPKIEIEKKKSIPKKSARYKPIEIEKSNPIPDFLKNNIEIETKMDNSMKHAIDNNPMFDILKNFCQQSKDMKRMTIIEISDSDNEEKELIQISQNKFVDKKILLPPIHQEKKKTPENKKVTQQVPVIPKTTIVNEKKPKFDWIHFHASKNEINYFEEFSKKVKKQDVNYKQLGFLETLFQDGSDYENSESNLVKFDDIAQSLQNRLNIYGQLNVKQIAKKTGAIKNDGHFSNYYDLDDSWLVPEDENENQDQMAIPQSTFNDFYSFSGNLEEFFVSPYYQQRCEELGLVKDHAEQVQKEKELREKEKKKQQRLEKCKLKASLKEMEMIKESQQEQLSQKRQFIEITLDEKWEETSLEAEKQKKKIQAD